MMIRRALKEDALDVLAWRNDAHAVAMSKSGRVVDVDDHLTWFPKALASSDCAMFIAEHEDRQIGMVRFDRAGDHWLVSINVAPNERRKGYGQSMLATAMKEVGGPLLAEIKSDNLPSIRIFERCGFRKIAAIDGWLKYERHE
jgi:RimJ/RimL family protein N-acetyltransferase